MNDLQIKFFLQVVRNQSISKTARDNYISQPAVSKHIRNLESELGVLLFNRTYQTIRLTDAGKVYHQLFSRFFYELEQTNQQVNERFLELGGEIRLGIPSSWNICTSVYQTIQSFATKHPDIHVSINSYSFKPLLSSLHCGKLDIILCIESILEDTANIITYPLGQVNRIFAYSASHPICSKKNLDASDFENELFLYYIDDGLDVAQGLLMDTCKHCGFTPASFRFVPNTESMLLEAQQGLGIALLNRMVYTRSLECFEIDRLSVISLAIRKGDNSPTIHAFINEVLFHQANSPHPERVYPCIMQK